MIEGEGAWGAHPAVTVNDRAEGLFSALVGVFSPPKLQQSRRRVGSQRLCLITSNNAELAHKLKRLVKSMVIHDPICD